MGSGHAIDMRAEQESECEPGTKCIKMQHPFADLDPPMTLRDAFNEVEVFMLSPIPPGTKRAAFLKSIELEEHGPLDGPTSFTVKVVLDGKKLDEAGRGRGDGMDKVLLWKRCNFFTAATEAYETSALVNRHMNIAFLDFVDELHGGEWADEATGEEGQSTILYGVDNRFEICVERDNRRDASEQMLQGCNWYADAVHEQWQQARSLPVQVTHGSPSLREEGKFSTMSCALDAHVSSYEDFVRTLVSTLQDTMGVDKMTTADVELPELVGQLSTTRTELSRDGDLNVQRALTHQEWHVCLETGQIVLSTPARSRELHCIVHRRPLVVETWTLSYSGERSSSFALARTMQGWINEAVIRASFSREVGAAVQPNFWLGHM